MYEYKFLTLNIKVCEKTLNELAQKGWRLVTVMPNIAKGYEVFATLERKVEE